MVEKHMGQVIRTWICSVAVLALAAFGLWFGVDGDTTQASEKGAGNEAVPAATFAGTGTGNIPDSASATCGTPGSPLNVTYNVTGISGAPSLVAVDFNVSTAHTWVGDLSVVLIAPNGTSHSVFGFTGAISANGAGSGNRQSVGVYTYRDSAANNWWTVATANPTIPTGSYRTSNSGGAGATNPMPNTVMNTAFSSIPTANGTWTLRLTDGCAGDTGAINASNLVIEGAPVVPVDAPNDINGDGRTDFMIVRADGPALAETLGASDTAGKDKVGNNARRLESAIPQVGIGWWTVLNNGSGATRSALGQDTDFFLMGDYDNDGKDDLTTWSPGAAGVARYNILRSSNNTLLTVLYGQSGDDPTIANDVNGDGRTDLVVYRDGTAGSPQSFFFWSNVDTPTSVNYIPFGTDGDVAFTLDYSGDGKADFAVQRNAGSGVGQFWILNSATGAFENFLYGLSSDFVVPGDYDGDGRDDICVSRNINFGSGTFKYFYIRESDGGGSPNTPQQWGIPGDFITQGDYDGDGKTDIAVWRPNADPNQNFFYYRKSSDLTLGGIEWGASGDYPVNNWNVH